MTFLCGRINSMGKTLRRGFVSICNLVVAVVVAQKIKDSRLKRNKCQVHPLRMKIMRWSTSFYFSFELYLCAKSALWVDFEISPWPADKSLSRTCFKVVVVFPVPSFIYSRGC